MTTLALSTWPGWAPSLSSTIWLAPLTVAFAAAVVLTPGTIGLANRLGIIDRPVGMKIHKVATPLLGGVAVYIAFFVASTVFLPLDGAVRGLLVGGAVAIVVGVVDDRYKLPPLLHLAGQVLAASMAIIAGLGYVNNISDPFATVRSQHQGQGSWTFTHLFGHEPMLLGVVLGIAFTLFWIVGMMNTVNFLDGLDGLSSGIAVIVALVLAVWALNPNNDFRGRSLDQLNHAPAILPVILIGSLLGFLVFNWNPARIFIGDSGAQFVGLALGVISVFGIAKIGTALIIVSIPVLDVAWAIVRRTLNRKSFLAGDKQHVYHRMIELGMSPRLVVLSMYAICGALAVIDLNIAHKPRLIAFGLIAVLAGLGFVSLEVAGNRRKASTLSRERPQKVEASKSEAPV